MATAPNSWTWKHTVSAFLIFGGLFGTIHLFNAYRTLLQHKPAFLYAPATDEIFYIEMAASMSPQNLLASVNPFDKVQHQTPVSIERAGFLTDILTEHERLQNETREESKARFEKSLAEAGVSPYRFNSSSCAILRYSSITVTVIESGHLRQIFDDAESYTYDGISKVGVAFLTRELEYRGNSGLVEVTPTTFHTIEDGILFEKYSIGPLLNVGLDAYVPMILNIPDDPAPETWR